MQKIIECFNVFVIHHVHFHMFPRVKKRMNYNLDLLFLTQVIAYNF